MNMMRAGTICIAGLSIGLTTAACQGQPEDVFWLETVNGEWDVPLRWSTETYFPNNGVPDPDDTYRAIIAASGIPYTVTMDDRFATYTLSEFTLNSPDLTFEHIRGHFKVNAIDFLSGTYRFSGSGTLAVLEDAIVTMSPQAAFVFSGYDGFPRQPTGAFRRCSIAGDLVLNEDRGGVIFEDAVDLQGDVYLNAVGTMAIFNGPGFVLESSTIFAAPGTSIEITTGLDPFVLEHDASIYGSPSIQPRGGGMHAFQNRGTIHIDGQIEDLTFHNIGMLSVINDSRLTMTGSDAAFTNDGTVIVGNAAELRMDVPTPVVNNGVFSFAVGSLARTLREFSQTTAGVSKFLIDPVDGTGRLWATDSRYEISLEGTLMLSVTVPSGFAPNDEFHLVDAATYSGQFATLDFAPIDGGLRFFVEYRADGVYAVVDCLSDWNRDGEVNTQDFLAYLNDWAGDELVADLNGDDVVNTQDFLEFLNEWVIACR